MKIRVVICQIVLLLLATASLCLADPTKNPLVQGGDISYVGRFALSNSGSTPRTYQYGGRGMGYYKTPNGIRKLYVSGHVYGPGYYGQVQIPSDGQLKPHSTGYSSLTQATSLQAIADAMEGHGSATSCSSNEVWSMGILPYNGRLIISTVCSYGGTGGHVVRDTLTVSGTGHVLPSSGLYSMSGGAPQRAIAGYMFAIPTEWQSLLGGPAMTGEGGLSVISTTSGGPALTVFDPDDVGLQNPIPGINLLHYPCPSTPVSCAPNGDCQSQVFNLTSRFLGGGFVPNTRTVFFVEGHGTGPYCYGTAQECGNDTVMSDVKGPHAQPYRYQILAYDANDLLAVKSGSKRPHEVQPYNAAAPWVLPEFNNEDPRGSAAAYDPESGRLYIRVDVGSQPVIDVYQIAAGSGDPTVPGLSTPSNVRVIQQP